MQIIQTVAELRAWSREFHRSGKTVGLVPTMGALHEGHLSLVRTAKAACDGVAVSIFVNPTQFGPNEDFALYPRTFDADCTLLKAEGVNAVFAPAPEEIYQSGASTFVEVAGLSDRLDGASRPGHFRGVATVVAKLLIAAEPGRAFFGQKDAAQVAVLRRMTADLGLPVELVICPIVRERDGLAMSSRNRYLSAAERRQALVLHRALNAVDALVATGERSSEALIAAAHANFATEPSVRVDYIAAVDWATLEPVQEARPGTLIAVAAFVGTTRLIDNLVVE
ncbi:pantoate--beta-alanine ligase [Acidicapsa acidisoli]|uniref:pantoate--beta-alanine ligase n=1 Tax=Acidicapsa acidisoli TaxID=1615681 RepID=UPI0021DF6346|nr:pantoate--beta-alanine ligase [Acidicapsa acidisoli]